MTTRAAIVCVVACLALVGCFGGDDRSTGAISVSQVYQPRYPLTIEGTSVHVSIRQDDREVSRFDSQKPTGTDRTELLRDELVPGAYEVRVAHRGCGPSSCAPGLPPGRVAVRCAGEATVTESGTTDVLIRVNPNGIGRCEVSETG